MISSTLHHKTKLKDIKTLTLGQTKDMLDLSATHMLIGEVLKLKGYPFLDMCSLGVT